MTNDDAPPTDDRHMTNDSDDICPEPPRPHSHCGPMTGEEYKQAREEIHDLFDEVREDLAEDLGGEPENYRPSVSDRDE